MFLQLYHILHASTREACSAASKYCHLTAHFVFILQRHVAIVCIVEFFFLFCCLHFLRWTIFFPLCNIPSLLHINDAFWFFVNRTLVTFMSGSLITTLQSDSFLLAWIHLPKIIQYLIPFNQFLAYIIVLLKIINFTSLIKEFLSITQCA